MMFGTKYNYSYGLMGQNDIVLDRNAVMHFEDSLIAMDFVIGQKSISFTMQNNSGKTARIIWDETLFIKYGSPGRVMHAGVKYTDRNNPQPPSIIPAMRRDRDSNPGDDLSDQHPFHENERNPFIFRHTENLRNFSGSNAV